MRERYHGDPDGVRHDRRISPRVRVDGRASWNEGGGGRVVEMNRGGLFVWAQVLPEVGSELEVRALLDDSSDEAPVEVRFRARAVYANEEWTVRRPMGVGLRFLEMGEASWGRVLGILGPAPRAR